MIAKTIIQLSAVFERLLRGSLQAAAARYFHTDDGDALDVVIADDLGQLVGVVDHIELRAADQGDLALHEFLVHIGVGVGGAVSGNQQLCAVIERSDRRQQFDLARPLVEP